MLAIVVALLLLVGFWLFSDREQPVEVVDGEAIFPLCKIGLWPKFLIWLGVPSYRKALAIEVEKHRGYGQSDRVVAATLGVPLKWVKVKEVKKRE